MKKIIIILTLALLNSLPLNSMQSSSIAQSEQSNMELSVRITGTKDEIDVVIPGKDAVMAGVLKSFLNDNTEANTKSGSSTDEKDFSFHIEPFSTFKSSDFERMGQHLNAIANRINEQDIFQACNQESIETNIKQLLLAHFLDIEKLLEAEGSVIQGKCCNPSLLVDFKNNPRLSELMQFIPGDIQWNIVETLRTNLGIPLKLDQHSPKDQLFHGDERCATSPDGNRIAKIVGRSAQIFDTSSGQLLCTMDHPNSIINAKFSPDENRIALVGHRSEVFKLSGMADCGRIPSTFIAMIFDINSGRLLHRLENTDSSDIIFSPDGNRIVMIDWDFLAKI